ncbi:hypothetical protein JD969_05755 [Planctomycetota bacterium]|nr:hypothetical protein JD969_05755 [Planctomycetota bacterium]
MNHKDFGKAFELPLGQDEFWRAMRQGLGRAILHVREHGVKDRDGGDLTEMILTGCLYSFVLNPLFDWRRAKWMLMMAEEAGIVDVVAERLLAEERVGDVWTCNDWHEEHRREIAKELYDYAMKRGDVELGERLKKWLYDNFRQHEAFYHFFGWEELFEVDGEKGLLFVCERLGQWFMENEDRREDGSVLEMYDEMYGKGEAKHVLDSASGESEGVRVFLERLVIEDEEEDVSEKKERRKHWWERLSGQEMVEAIRSKRNAPEALKRGYRFWGMRADEEDLKVVADAMYEEVDEGFLKDFMWVFDLRALPRVEQKAIDWMGHEDREVRQLAYEMMGNVKDERVRAWGMRKLKAGEDLADGAYRLFKVNMKAGDEKLLREAARVFGDPDDLHGEMLDIVNLVHEQKDAELVDLIMFIYEWSPCGECKKGMVEKMRELECLPRWVDDELTWDVSAIEDKKL